MAIHNDGGYKSRKLFFSLFAVGVIVAAGLGAAFLKGLVPIYETLVGGVVAISGLYLTGNIAGKWSATKLANATGTPVEDPPKKASKKDEGDADAPKPPAPRFED